MRYVLLEPLRGLAALWVFGFHYGFSESFQKNLPGLHAFLASGDFGVPMFFVLSGFCITASARSSVRRGESTGGFLYRRLKRIYPPFWISIVVVAAIPFLIELLSSFKSGNFVPPSAENPNYGYLDYDFGDWVRLATLAQVFTPPVEGTTNLQIKFTSINAVYWTLAIEVQFYLVVTLAVWFRRIYETLLVVTVVSLPFLFYTEIKTSGIFLPFWPMFATGVLLAWLFENKLAPTRVLSPGKLVTARLAAVAIFVGSIVYFAFGGGMTAMSFALLFGVFLYLAESLDGPFADRVVASNRTAIRANAILLMSLGAMSYSLYLLHSRLQFLTIQVLRQAIPPNSILFDLLAIVVTSAICFVFYLLFERPFMSQHQRRMTDPVLANAVPIDPSRIIAAPVNPAPTSAAIEPLTHESVSDKKSDAER